MLVTFTTEAYADTTMLGAVALTMLKKMGHNIAVPGVILAAEVPLALSRLKAAIIADKLTSKVADKNADEPHVSMAHRGLPLLHLLTAAANAGRNVIWK